jgi:hypothetical protein
LADERKKCGEVVILEDGAKGIPQEQVGIAFGKGGTGHTDGVFRHRFQGVRVCSDITDILLVVG